MKRKTFEYDHSLEETTHRVAHKAPAEKSLQKPMIPFHAKYKVATKTRQQFLDMFWPEYKRILLKDGKHMRQAENESYRLGLEAEKRIYDNILDKNVYTSRCKRHFLTLKKTDSMKSISKIENPMEEKKAEFYHQAKKYILTKAQLQENSFHLISDLEDVFTPSKGSSASLPAEDVADGVYYDKKCCRCGLFFSFRLDSATSTPVYQNPTKCCYHSGRTFTKKGANQERYPTYSCCSGFPGDAGCKVSSHHVWEEDKTFISPETYVFPSAMEANSSSTDENISAKSFRVYSIDCEMCNTTLGLELARISVIDDTLETVYESLVKPKGYILDYNTQFSGLTEEIMKQAKVSLAQVHKSLSEFIFCETILVGHSFDSDLRAMKVIHENVVDTSVLFPHPLGLPYKRSLKNLSQEILKRFIQVPVSQDEKGISGHDSTEDASTCMRLLQWLLLNQTKIEKNRNPILIFSSGGKRQC
eukprot:Sdes_comp19107_c0_seq1m9795